MLSSTGWLRYIFTGCDWDMIGPATSAHTTAIPSLLLESIVTSTKISVMPSSSSRNNSTEMSTAGDTPLRTSMYANNVSPVRHSTTARFDRNEIIPFSARANYSTSFMSSTLGTLSRKSRLTARNIDTYIPDLERSSLVRSRDNANIPALPSRVLNCEQCGRSYACEYTLKRHLRLECGKEATLQCPLCSRRTKHKHSLLRHINKFHPGTPI